MVILANVTRRAGIFHFRRVVPASIRDVIGRRELIRTLETTDPRIARPRAAQLYLASEHIFEVAQQPSMLDKTKLARLVQDFYATMLELENRARLTMRHLPSEAREKRHAYLADVAAKAKDSLACNRLGDAAMITEGMLRKQGIAPTSLDPTELAQARQAVLRAGINVAEALKARYEGDFNYEPSDQLLKLQLQEADKEASSEPNSTMSAPDKGELHATAPVMSIIGAAFRESQVATGAWDRQTAHQAGATYRIFQEICGDRELAAYTRKDAGRFKDQIERLPSDYGKSSQYKGLPVADILMKLASLSDADRPSIITQKTVKRHFSALSALWTSCKAKGEVAENVFSGFRFANSKRAHQQRDMWEPEELGRLFASPVWAGSKSVGRRTVPGDLVLRDEKFWLPLIAVLSGLREEEICQLHVEDFKRSDGIDYFDINAAPPRKLKNHSAVRYVPIHSTLLRIGLLTHVDQQKLEGHKRLFPALVPGGADERLGHNFTKWFTRYRQQIGLYRSGLDFHSFRHTATTLMHQAGIERSIIDHVTGHVTPGETTRYTKRSHLSQMSQAIESIDIGVGLTSLFTMPSSDS